jgi:non-specific serine/threonine protein kinase/serine/threonine-protein kinase
MNVERSQTTEEIDPFGAATTAAPSREPGWIADEIPCVARPLPAHIGQYRILSLLGEGGMGAVYRAEQEHPRRIVALKVIKPGLATPELLRRFERESLALGRLQHPGIAQIYESGIADAGYGRHHYFAMEFIQGHSLCEHAEARQLNVRERLELLVTICEAVQHAHQRCVIHRDLKPSNILVNESGQPRILDFGVARATDSGAHATRQTDLGQLVGTLAYMSPEQVLGDPLELDTRSDVYALGVILYELLAGRLPYQIGQKLHEAVRTIREEDPVRLGSINRACRGDVETIVARAMEKEKTRRYASAADLSADIQRYLRDQPIIARPASAAYQLQKFALRHTAVVSGVAAVFVVLAAGIVASTSEAARATRARQDALLERDRAAAAEQKASRERDRALAAERAATAAQAQALLDRNRALAEEERADAEASNAKAMNDFLQNDLLAQASQVGAKGQRDGKPDPDLKVRSVLDRAAARIEGRFPSQPLLEASIRHTMGLAYYGLGLYPEAEKQMERSANLRRGTIGDSHRETLDSMSYLADTFREQGKFTEAEVLFNKVLEGQRRVLGEEHPDTLSTKNNLALVYMYQGRYAQTEPLLAGVVKASRRVRGEEDPETLGDINNLAVVYGYLGRFRQAGQLYVELLNVLRRVLGEEQPQTLNTMSNLADIYRYEGEFGKAESLVTRALEVRRRVLGPEHPETLISMSVLALVYRGMGRYSEAEPLFTQVLDGRRRFLGEQHVDTLKSATYLADLYRNQGRDAQAEALYTMALEALRRRPGGQDHPQTLNSMNSLALLYLGQEKYAEAEQLLAKVVEGRRRKLGPQHPATSSAMALLGQARLQQGKYAEAERIIREALESQEKTNPDVWERHNSQTLLGAALAGQARYSEAEPLLQAGYKGLIERQAAIPRESRSILDQAALRIVQLYQDWGKLDQATEWRDRLRRP